MESIMPAVNRKSSIIYCVGSEGVPVDPPAYYKEWAVLTHFGRTQYDRDILKSEEWKREKKNGWALYKYKMIRTK